MKTKNLIKLTATALAVACIGLLAKEDVKWEFDGMRKHNEQAKERAERRDEFNRTNTNPNQHMIHVVGIDTIWPMDFTTNQIELGFRNDGVVVWRVPPEAR